MKSGIFGPKLFFFVFLSKETAYSISLDLSPSTKDSFFY